MLSFFGRYESAIIIQWLDTVRRAKLPRESFVSVRYDPRATMYKTFFFFFSSPGGWGQNEACLSSPHFHVFPYASCVCRFKTQLLSQPNASYNMRRSAFLGDASMLLSEIVTGGSLTQLVGNYSPLFFCLFMILAAYLARPCFFFFHPVSYSSSSSFFFFFSI